MVQQFLEYSEIISLYFFFLLNCLRMTNDTSFGLTISLSTCGFSL